MKSKAVLILLMVIGIGRIGEFRVHNDIEVACYARVIRWVNPRVQDNDARRIVGALRAAGVSDEDMPVHLAVMWQETHYRPNLIGDKGRSLGLYQIGLWEARTVDSGITREMLLEIEHNVRVGAVYLRRLIERYGLDRALKRYNGSWSYVKMVKQKIQQIQKINQITETQKEGR